MAAAARVDVVQQLLLLLVATLLIGSCCPSAFDIFVCATATSHAFTTTLRKSSPSSSSSSSSKSSSRSKLKTTSGSKKKKSSFVFVGHDTGSTAGIIITIIIGVAMILIVAIWWWRRRSAQKYIQDTEKLAASYGIGARDGELPLRFFRHAEVKQATDDFASKQEIGCGSFGNLYRGVLDDETQVAIKSVKTSGLKGKEQVLNEVQTLSKVNNHPHLVRLLGFCVRWKCVLLVYEHAPNGSLFDQLVHKDGSTVVLDWKTRLQIASQSAGALAHLHSTGLSCHGNVNSNSILLDQSMNAKVSDYGLKHFLGTDRNVASKCPPPSERWPWKNFRSQKLPQYAFVQAPVLSSVADGEHGPSNPDQKITNKSDVYGFGMVLLELISATGALAGFKSGQHINIVNQHVVMMQNKKEQGKLDDVLDPELVRGASVETLQSMGAVFDLALECLHENGVNRPGMEEVAERLRQIVSSLGKDSDM